MADDSALHQRLLELSGSLVCVLDTAGRLIEISDSWSTLLGWSSDELHGIDHLDLVHPDDVEATRAVTAAWADGAGIEGFENRYRHRDGSYRSLRWSTAAIADGDRVYALAHDVTDTSAERRRLRGFEELVSLSQEGILELLADGTVRYANRRMAEFLGSEAAELVGRNCIEVLDAETTDAVQAWRRTLLRDADAVVRGELELGRVDGSRLWVQIAARAVGDDDGRVDRVVAVVTDISEQKEREARLARVLAATRDGWWEVDRRAGTMFASARFNEILGFPPNHVHDEHTAIAATVAPPPDGMTVEQHTAQHEGDDGVFVVETEVIPTDGSRVPVVFTGRVERDQAGHVVRVSGTVTDISAERRSESAKDAFVARVSHELRTPLTAISGVIETLARGAAGQVPDPARVLLDAASRNVVRLRELIDDLLDLEQVQPAQQSLRFEPVELVALIERSLVDNAPLATEQAVRFELGHRDHAVVAAEPRRLEQVLANLLANATRYAPAGTAVTVNVRVANPSGTVRIEVVDTGPGIPAAFRARMFEPFSLADPSDRSEFGGTGLGLAIVQGIVSQHGGEVGADSVPGRTAVWFELPLHTEPTDR